ncbi:hypothetical protein [Elizabethkingia miricola]|uniref:hypothetical protein n=1 Tax=Elizabethkingia miricola TaxID=172045 RepID=UPI003892B4B1
MDKKNSRKIELRIVGIDASQFQIKDIGEVLEQDIYISNEFGFGIDNNHAMIACKYRFQMSYKKKSFASIEVMCLFQIKKTTLKKFKIPYQKKYSFPFIFIKDMTEMTISTTRGILFEKMTNSPYQKFILPLIDLKNIFDEENIEIEYEY